MLDWPGSLWVGRRGTGRAKGTATRLALWQFYTMLAPIAGPR